MSDAKRPGRRGARLALVVASPLLIAVLLFGIGEAVMRVLHSHDLAAFPTVLAPATAEGETTPDGRPIFRKIGELVTPHADGVFRSQRHRTDAIGFRGPDRPRRAAPGTRRVLVTGDSITMGSGVAEEDTFPAVAEALLDREASPPRWELVNAGLAGAPLKAALDRLQQGIDYYGGDLYVYAFVPNDIEGPAYRHFPAERTAFDLIGEAGWPARSRSALIRVAAWEWLDLWDRIEALNLAQYEHELRFNYFENPPAWRRLLKGLDRLAAMGTAHDRCVVVLMLTRIVALEPASHPFNDVYDVVGDAARERGLHVVETRPSFLGRDPDDLRHSQLDPHPNAAGHALLGRVLADGIVALPERCWEH